MGRIMTTTVKVSMRIAGRALLIAALLLATFVPANPAHAAQITSRKLTLSNSAATGTGSTGVSYTFNFTPPTSTPVLSMNIDFCDTASGSCVQPTNVPSGMLTTSATVGSVSGIGTGGTWTGTFTTNGRIRLANASNTGAPSATTVVINNITNPSTTNQTFYARITTYSASNFTGALDTGTVAASTANAITVSASVDETLTFCSATSGVTNSSCSGATGSSLNLGTLTSSTTGSGTSQLGAATNAGSGYAITVAGATLTAGSYTITANSSNAASTQGTEQFGLNLATNTTPAVGQAPDGTGTGTATANYATANSYRFVSGDTLASVATADNFRRYTVSYIANAAGATEPGSYSTTLTYVCTATF